MNGNHEKGTFVSVFLTLEVYLLVKLRFLFLTTSLVAAQLSRSSAGADLSKFG